MYILQVIFMSSVTHDRSVTHDHSAPSGLIELIKKILFTLMFIV